jgi:hypothetical protein
MTSQTTSRRLTVQEAAEALGTSVDAVRMRVRRGSLESEKAPDGRVYVHLNVDSSETRPRPDVESAALLESKDETISLLKDQLREEREARRRADTLLAQLTQATSNLTDRLRELGAPADTSAPTEASEEAAQEPASPAPGTAPAQGATGAQGGAQKPWWRRVFGG